MKETTQLPSNIEQEDRPSSVALPLVLRQAHGLPSPSFPKLPPRENFTSAESIQEAMEKTTSALSQIQRQIHQGEECYFEETGTLAGGSNIFKGWDAYIDARLSEPSASDVRRMPADFRWASSSSAIIRAAVPMKRVTLEQASAAKKVELDPEPNRKRKVESVQVSEEDSGEQMDEEGDDDDGPQDAKTGETDAKETEDPLSLPIKRKAKVSQPPPSSQQRRTKRKRHKN